jgi:ATP-dependent protease HslVU (ClpYQ) peptidase subunit
MTCIVGLKRDGSVYIGADSAGVSGWSIEARADQKVFRNDAYLMGFTTSFRMGQLLQYALVPPRPPNYRNLDGFMVTEFVDAVRTCLTNGGWMSKRGEREEGGQFLVGVQGELFCVDSDFQISRTVNGYTAIGCGADIALGSLHTNTKATPQRRVRAALAAAAHHSAGVAAPFSVRRLAP